MNERQTYLFSLNKQEDLELPSLKCQVKRMASSETEGEMPSLQPLFSRIPQGQSKRICIWQENHHCHHLLWDAMSVCGDLISAGKRLGHSKNHERSMHQRRENLISVDQWRAVSPTKPLKWKPRHSLFHSGINSNLVQSFKAEMGPVNAGEIRLEGEGNPSYLSLSSSITSNVIIE